MVTNALYTCYNVATQNKNNALRKQWKIYKYILYAEVQEYSGIAKMTNLEG